MKKYIYAILWLFAAAGLLIYSNEISYIALGTMESTVKNILPVLFPYSVLASLMVSLGAAEVLGRIIPIGKLLLLPDNATAPFLIGAVCGFPLGAKTACDMYERGLCTRSEAEFIVSISNNTGPAFVINVIGGVCFGDVRVGIVIYVMQLVAAITVSLFDRRAEQNDRIDTNPIPLGKAISEAVQGSVISCLYICGFIVIFSSVMFALRSLPEGIYNVICTFCEFTCGAANAAAIGGLKGIFLAAFSVGWSGLSVLFQTVSSTFASGLSLKPLICAKLTQGIICGALSAAYFSSFRYTFLMVFAAMFIFLYIFKATKVKNISKKYENENFS